MICSDNMHCSARKGVSYWYCEDDIIELQLNMQGPSLYSCDCLNMIRSPCCKALIFVFLFDRHGICRVGLWRRGAIQIYWYCLQFIAIVRAIIFVLIIVQNKQNSNLVDPASSHTLVSKIKPCMSKYKRLLYCETAYGSLYQLLFLR